MLTFFVILIAFVVLYFVYKIKHYQNRISITVIVLSILFLYISVAGVMSKNNIQVNSITGLVSLGQEYFKWVGHVFENTKTIIGNVVRMDWGPQ